MSTTEAKDGGIINDTPHKITAMVDILIEILSRLPASSLSRLKFVSKLWYSIITDDPILPNLHLDRGFKTSSPSIIIESRVRRLILMDHQGSQQRHVFGTDQVLEGVSPSCNGLLCIYYDRIAPFLLNPTTGEVLPLPTREESEGSAFSKFYLGYSPKTMEYKVIGLTEVPHKCEILTMGSESSGSWRWSESSVDSDIGICSGGICIDGFIYWLLLLWSTDRIQIVSFDLHNEMFGRVEFPGYLDSKDVLLEVEGQLCVALVRLESLEILMLESNTWVKRYKLYFPLLYGPPILIHQGGILVDSREDLHYLDLQTGCVNIGKVYDDGVGWGHTAYVHKESLVSLKSL